MTTWVRRRTGLALLTGALALAACATPPKPAANAAAPPAAAPKPIRAGLDPATRPDPFPSTYKPAPAGPVLFVNATILTAAGPRIDGGSLLIRDGRIAAVGKDIAHPADAKVIDAGGRWLTPGIVDPHAHIGAGSSPTAANGDGSNESGPNPGGVWIEHSVWTQDPMFERARQAGVTTVQILPGSSNLFNGRTVTLKNVPATAPQGMKFPGAPYGLKMACGENPTGGGAGKPGTRAGGMMGYRNTFIAAQAYAQSWADWRKRGAGDPPRRDLMLETVAGALNGDIKVHIHCYRADEMVQMIDLSHEFGFRIAAFHHALEAFKIAPLLAREKIAVVTWAGDWSGYKMEAYDSIMENAAFVEKAGGVATMHSDNVMLMQHLNQEAARAMTAGREAGLGTTPEQAIAWVTLNPAKVIGVADRVGSLEVGKMADVVLWDGDPFSVYSLPDLVFIDGALIYDRAAPGRAPQSDFELGNARRPVSPARPAPRGLGAPR
ncbi:MAG: amidohydrolase [Phenylobacterium sp.]|uniref:amidohydrolase n=1 Tax=Phenylobacterium sp. TaxID=1871053 RepID=UPI0012012050|nr:amidohydrolase [Phenylobacterium sp.]TAJ71286.1 MAG: amidohydrolase [Phenylobacterium sp.]